MHIAGNIKDLNLFFSDGVHPSKLAYEVWAKETVAYLVQENVLKEQKSI